MGKDRIVINQFENGRATVQYRCFACGEATTGDGGEPFHVECAPPENDEAFEIE